MEKIGIVDLGSNTARLVVYGYRPGRWFRLVDEIREPVRLGEGLVSQGRLSEAAVERALAALRLYADFARATELERIEIAATSAVRDADNRDEFLAAVDQIGLPYRVLSGEEEAELGVLAVANSFRFRDAWVMDLGGGSAQVSLMRERAAARCRSVPLGGVRLTEAHLPTDPPAEEEIGRLEARVGEELGPVIDEMLLQPFPIVAMGGTVRNLARAIQRRESYPLDIVHRYFLRRDRLDELVDHLASMPASRRARIPGIHPDRADVILAGALVFRFLLRALDREGLWVAGQGVREGLFYRRFLPPPHLVKSVRGFALRNLFERYAQPRSHVRGVRFLAGRLFDLLKPLHPWGDQERALLDAAAYLHDIGTTVNYYDHHHHGGYLVLSAAIPGLSHREQCLLALLVRYHRKGRPRLTPWGALAQPGDKRLLRGLATCLRLAEHFERSRAGRVKDLEVEIKRKTVVVRLMAEELPRVELWEASKHAPLFERAFGRRLRLEPSVAPPEAT